MAYNPENLGNILKFKYPDDYKTGKILVQKDNSQQDPYIKKWTVADPLPTDAQLDAWEQEWLVDEANQSSKEAERAAAEARLRAPYGNTTSVTQLRAMVDDIVSYLKLD